MGDGTRKLATVQKGDTVNVVLPLGNGFTMPASADTKVLLVGGGVGTAPMLYLGEALLKQGCKPTFLLGARSKNDLLQLEQFEALGDVYTTTEDGSMGEKGYVTMHSVLKAQKFDMIYTCGPETHDDGSGQVCQGRRHRMRGVTGKHHGLRRRSLPLLRGKDRRGTCVRM